MVDIIPLLNPQDPREANRARKAFSQAGLGAFTQTTLRLSTIEAATAFLKEPNLHALGNDELIKLIRTLAHQPDRVEFGSLGGGLRRRDMDILMKLRDISYDENFAVDIRQESRAALMSILHTIRDASVGEANKLNPEAAKMAGFVEKLVLADSPVKALHAVADIIDATEFRKQDAFLFFSRNASLEQDVSKTLDGILSGLDPTLLKFYKSVVNAELKNTFERSEQILLGQGEEDVAFRKKPGSFRLLAGLRRALSEKFETSIPEAAKYKESDFPTEDARIAAEKKGYVRDEFEILQHMVEMLRHAPLGNLKAGATAPNEYLRAKEKLLKAVNKSAEKAFILEMEIKDLEDKIKNSETKALHGEGDRGEHLRNVSDIRKNQLAKKIAEHKTLLAKRATEAALIEQTWKKMESVTSSRVLQETLQTELFGGLISADRRIDTKALQTIFPLNEWGPLSDASNFSMKEILEAYDGAMRNDTSIKLTIPANSTHPAETIEYRKGSAQYHMIQHFANERKQRVEDLQAQETELVALKQEQKQLMDTFSAGGLGDLIKGLFNSASSQPSVKRYTVLNQDLEALGQSGSTHAEDLRVSLKDSAAEFNRAIETLNKLNLGTRFPDSSKDPNLANALTALDAFKQGNYDRLNSSGWVSDVLKHLMVLQTAVSPEGKNILDVNEVDSLKRIGTFLKDDQKRAESELLLINRVVSFEAEQGIYSARQQWKEAKKEDPSQGPVSQAHEPTGFIADAAVAAYKDDVEHDPFPPVGRFEARVQSIDPQQPLKTGRKLKLDTEIQVDSSYLEHPEKIARSEDVKEQIARLEQNLSVMRDEGKFYARLEAEREKYFTNTIQRSTEIKQDYLFMMGLADPHRVEEQIFKPLNGAMDKYFSERGVKKEDSPLWQAFQHFVAYVITFAHNYVNQDPVNTGLIGRMADGITKRAA